MRSNYLRFGMLGGFAFLLLSCSTDVTIVEDYKIYDLGGSNQSIIGNRGMTSIFDVTAYSVVGKYIYVEHGGHYDKTGKRSAGDCKYSVIDTDNNRIIKVTNNMEIYQRVVGNIAKNGESFVTRSCVYRI